MRSFTARLVLSGCALASVCPPALADSLVLGQSTRGSIDAPAQKRSYLFAATAGSVFEFTMAATSGTLSPKMTVIKPDGTALRSAYPAYCSGSTIEMNTLLIPASGTYTLVTGDCSDTHTGEYHIYGQAVNHPAAAAALVFGQTPAGTIALAAESKTYTFSANVNDNLVVTMVAKSGTLSPKIRIYNGSSGALLSAAYPAYCSGSTTEMNTIQVPATGTYTVLVGDCSDTHTGDYDLYAQRTDNPSGAATLPFGGIPQTGTISPVGQSKTYTFSASANDIMEFTMVATSGTLSPKIELYKPDGTLLRSAYPAYCSGSSIEMSTVLLPATGTYTVLAGDCSDTKTGTYNLYAQRTNRANGAANLPFGGQPQTGLIAEEAQSNTYTFSATANDVIEFTMAMTSGTLSPKIRLYKPNGTLLQAAYPAYCSGSTIEMNTGHLPATGIYTVLVGDCSDTHTGNYDVYAQRTNNPSGATTLTWNVTIQHALLGFAAESDTYVLAAAANDVVDLTMTTTSGNVSPKLRLYKPDGSLLQAAYPAYCSGSTIEMNVRLPAAGTYIVLAGDCSDTHTGEYNLFPLCFGVCRINQTATPVYSPLPGPYSSPVTITDSTPGAIIYYTTNGLAPTTSSTRYSGPITLNQTTTIKAIAVAPGYPPSSVATATYTFTAATPAISPASKTYFSAIFVTITDATPGAIIYYTTNGTQPTSTSNRYTAPIRVSSNLTIKAIAMAPGFSNSPVASTAYVIIGSPSALASPATSITATGATLHGILNNNGAAASFAFEYGTTSTSLNKRTPDVPLAASTATVSVNAPITGLVTGTKYYYRVVVTTPGGTASGSVISFQTK